DGAALVGAEAFDLADVTATPDGLRAELEPAEVRAAVSEYLAGTATGSFEALALESATSLDGRSATVTSPRSGGRRSSRCSSPRDCASRRPRSPARSSADAECSRDSRVARLACRQHRGRTHGRRR